MADEEIFVDEEIAGGGDAGGGKTGFLPAAILKILKWVALGLAAVIFIVTIVVLTVSFIVRGPAAESYPSAAEEYRLVQPILSWYDIGEIRTRTSDETPVTVIVSAKIGYDPNNKSAQNDINQRREQIIDRTRFFFSQKREAELNARFEAQLKNELKEMINGIVGRPYVRDIAFLSFNVMEF